MGVEKTKVETVFIFKPMSGWTVRLVTNYFFLFPSDRNQGLRHAWWNDEEQWEPC